MTGSVNIEVKPGIVLHSYRNTKTKHSTNIHAVSFITPWLLALDPYKSYKTGGHHSSGFLASFYSHKGWWMQVNALNLKLPKSISTDLSISLLWLIHPHSYLSPTPEGEVINQSNLMYWNFWSRKCRGLAWICSTSYRLPITRNKVEIKSPPRSTRSLL
jgi:hypothetical protein